FAIKLAKQCGQIILDASNARYSTNSKVLSKNDNKTDLVTETDQMIEDLIKSKLKECFPEHKLVFIIKDEKTTAAGYKYEFTDDPTWIVDPIVITEYGNDRSDNTISKKINSVHNLLRKPGAVSWSSKKAGLVRGIRSVGSAALNICQVAQGHADIFFEFGCWEWDVAAALVILNESGGMMVNAQGYDEGPVDIFGRKYLAIRGGSPCDGDEDSKQSQLRLIREMWDVIEDVD
ncbi:3974_t:CDS:2, partial [Racocetra fulgida]